MVGLTYAHLSQRQTFGLKEVSHCSSQTHSILKFDNFWYTPPSEDKKLSKKYTSASKYFVMSCQVGNHTPSTKQTSRGQPQLRGTQRAANSQNGVLQTNAHEVVEVSGNELITLHIAKRDKVGGSGACPLGKF